MSGNVTLRYGLKFERKFVLDLSMEYQFYIAFLHLFLSHPIVEYLLIFESKSMQKDIRILYIFTHLALVFAEWIVYLGFRIYVFAPFSALYCEGPLCKFGIDKQILLTLLALPIILISSPFVTLMARMHQMFIPVDSKWKFSSRAQIALAFLLNALLFANVAGFGIFGIDHDDSERIMKEPELVWLSSRGGTIFLFGPPGDPQHFKYELMFLFFSILMISPFLYLFTADSIRVIWKTSSMLKSSSTQGKARMMLLVFLFQCLGALFCYIVPLSIMLSSMIIDSTFVPGRLFSFGRIFLVGAFQFNGCQFCMFFIFKNPNYRKILAQKLQNLLPCFTRREEVFHTISPNNFSFTSKQDSVRF